MSATPSTDADRVALVFSSLSGGGIQRVMLNLAGAFLAEGLQVDLVVVDARGELVSQVPGQARVVDLRSRRSIYALPGLVGYLRRYRPRAVLASQTHLNLLTLAARGLARVPARVVVSEHVALDQVLRHAATWKERVFPMGARLWYGRADGLVVVSHDAAARFIAVTGLPAGAATVIHNPVVTAALFEQAALPVDHPWFAAGEPPVILSAGRLTAQKDHATLIEAFQLLRRTVRARLIVLGDGEERHALESLIERLQLRSDVQLAGFVQNPFGYMARARLFVLSSRWEGFGNVLVEAMACGTPVVSTDCPSGPSEILQGGRFGRLAPVGDPAALAEAMRQTLDHPTSATTLRERAMEFSVDRVARRYLGAMLS